MVDARIALGVRTIGDFYNEAQDRALARKKAEKELEGSASLKDLAEESYWKKVMGAPLSEQENRLADGYDRTKQGYYFDSELGTLIKKPSMFGGGGNYPSRPMGDLYDGSFGMEDIPPVSEADLAAPAPGPAPFPAPPAGGMDPMAAHMAARKGQASILEPLLQQSGPYARSSSKATNQANVDLQKQSIESRVNLLGPVDGVIPTDDDAKKMKDMVEAAYEINNKLKSYEDALSKNPAPIAGSVDAQNLNNIKGQMIAAVKKLETLGALDLGVERLTDKILGNPIVFGSPAGVGDLFFNPVGSVVSTASKLTNPEALNANSIRNSRDYIRSKIEAAGNTRGYDVSGLLKVLDGQSAEEGPKTRDQLMEELRQIESQIGGAR